MQLLNRFINLTNPIHREHPFARGLWAAYSAVPGIAGGGMWLNMASWGSPNKSQGTLSNFAKNVSGTSGWTGYTHPGGRGSLLFDGSSTYVTMGSLIGNSVFGTKACTYACWVNVVAHNSGYDTILGQGTSGSDFDLLIDQSSHVFSCYAGNSGAANTTTVAAAGTWYHLMGTLDPGVDGIIYLNGRKEGSNNNVSTNWQATDFQLGHSNVWGRYANILLDEVWIWRDRLFSPQDVLEFYRSSCLGHPGLIDSLQLPESIFTASATGSMKTSYWAWNQYGTPAQGF